MSAEEESRAPAVDVVGLGNVLMCDDAVGAWVVRILEGAWELPPTVSVRDLGTPGLGLLSEAVGAVPLVVVDAVRADGEPGDVRAFRNPTPAAAGPRLACHDPGLAELLETARLADAAPDEVVVVGIVPARVEPGIGLSEPVTRALPRAAEMVADEIERLGVPVRRRRHPRPPDIWWEQSPALSAGHGHYS